MVGLYVKGGSGTIVNYGTIAGVGTAVPSVELGVGAELGAGGTIVNGAANDAGAAIAGSLDGVEVIADTATVTNFGIIGGTAFGVMLGGGGTVVDTGTISGSTAIHFGGTGDNLLVLTPGYKIAGSISALGTGNTLELLGSATSAVTANFTSLDPAGFQTVAFAPGAGGYATLKITNDAALPGTIAGFIGAGETIDLTALSDASHDASTSFNTATNVLTVTGDNGSVMLQLNPGGSYSGMSWTAGNDGSNGTTVVLGPALPPPSGTLPSISGAQAKSGRRRWGDRHAVLQRHHHR